MAFPALSHWEVNNNGADGTTGNGGGFCGDTSVITMATDLAGVSGCNTASPVVSSASYNFVAGDVGGYLYVAAGTNWIPGWYPIVSVASNQATLNAAIGAVTLLNLGLNTAVGCASTATPTGGTWTVDYSRSTSPRYTYADLAGAGAGSIFASALNPFGPNCPGNVIAFSSGTNVTVQRAMILSVASVTATFDKAVTTGVTTNGAGKLGGCLATVGQAGALHVGSNNIWLAYNASPNAVTSTSANVASGRLSLSSGTTTVLTSLCGYESVRGDATTKRPTYQCNANSITLIGGSASNSRIYNIILDGNRSIRTGSAGVNSASVSNMICQRIWFKSFNSVAYNIAAGGNELIDFEISDCTTAVITLGSGARVAIKNGSIHDNTATCIADSGSITAITNIIAYNNTGASTDFYSKSTGSLSASAITIGTIGRHGFSFTASQGLSHCINCYVEGAGGYAFNFSAAMDGVRLLNCGGYNNASGPYTLGNFGYGMNIVNFINLNSTAFVNLAAGNLALNTGGGALLRSAGLSGSFGGISTVGYLDVGAVQHQDPQYLRGRKGL